MPLEDCARVGTYKSVTNVTPSSHFHGCGSVAWLTRCLYGQIHGCLKDPRRRISKRRWRWCCSRGEGKGQAEVRQEAYKPGTTERDQSNVEGKVSEDVS